MESILQFPGRAYDYIHGNYGLTGLIFAALLIVLAGIAFYIWLDRRR